MKTFNRNKYRYIGVIEVPKCQDCDRECYFAFQCIKSDFSPEIVLVKEARLLYDNWGCIFFNKPEKYKSSQCVKGKSGFEKSLVYNERKWLGTERPT